MNAFEFIGSIILAIGVLGLLGFMMVLIFSDEFVKVVKIIRKEHIDEETLELKGDEEATETLD